VTRSAIPNAVRQLCGKKEDEEEEEGNDTWGRLVKVQNRQSPRAIRIREAKKPRLTLARLALLLKCRLTSPRTENEKAATDEFPTTAAVLSFLLSPCNGLWSRPKAKLAAKCRGGGRGNETYRPTSGKQCSTISHLLVSQCYRLLHRGDSTRESLALINCWPSCSYNNYGVPLLLYSRYN
jgi:hypothetical protein